MMAMGIRFVNPALKAVQKSKFSVTNRLCGDLLLSAQSVLGYTAMMKLWYFVSGACTEITQGCADFGKNLRNFRPRFRYQAKREVND